MKITIPSPPGLPFASWSSRKFGFQLLQAQTLPPWSMLTPVVRMNGM
jgi:hypothetical protein